MNDSLYETSVYDRIEQYFIDNVLSKSPAIFERDHNRFLLDSFQRLSFIFEFPQRLSQDSTTNIEISAIPASLSGATTPDLLLEYLHDFVDSLRNLLSK